MTLTELHSGQTANDTHCYFAGVDPLASTDQSLDAAQRPAVGAGDPSPVPASRNDSLSVTRTAREPEMIGWNTLRLAAEIAEDVVKQEQALTNRMRAAAHSPATRKHLERMWAALHQAKLAADLNRRDVYRSVVPPSIRDWQVATIGVGEKGLARLLGNIGHPAWKWQHEAQGSTRAVILVDSSPRTFSQLVAYCGLVPGRHRRKGMTAGDAQALGRCSVGPILHSIADSAGIKLTASPYRAVYDEARTFYDTQDITPMHAMNRALRIVKREILRDLWTVACKDLIPPSPSLATSPKFDAVTVG
jgi:hypothetical protein